MKTGVKVFLGFAAGLAVGAVGTGIGLKKYYEKQLKEEIIPDIKQSYDDRLDALEEELKAERAARKEIQDEIKGKYASKEEKKPEKEEKSDKVKVEKSKKPSGKAKLDTNKVDYTSHFAGMDVDDSERIKFDMKPKEKGGLKVDDQGHVYSKMASKGKPFIISIDEYTDMNGYDKQTYTYWAYDEVFTDETEEPDLNIVMYLGHDLVELWDEYSPDHESLYIRNPQQKTDYEIIVREQSYADYMREPDFDE
jgi:hypothetical protein